MRHSISSYYLRPAVRFSYRANMWQSGYYNPKDKLRTLTDVRFWESWDEAMADHGLITKTYHAMKIKSTEEHLQKMTELLGLVTLNHG